MPNSHRRRRWSSLLVPCAAWLLGCSAPAPKPAPQPPSVQSSRHQAVNPLLGDDDASGDGMQVEGTLGTLDEEQIQGGLASRARALAACFQRQVMREPYLGGELTLFFRVARDGATKRVHLSQSSVGSLAVERCALESVRLTTFGRPRGGEAEFSYPLKFQGRLSALSWDPAMVKKEILDHVEQLLAGPSGGDPPLRAPASLVVTFYVDPRGKVVSAGMTAEDVVSPAFADRFVENLKHLTFEAASSGYAKVSYPW